MGGKAYHNTTPQTTTPTPPPTQAAAEVRATSTTAETTTAETAAETATTANTTPPTATAELSTARAAKFAEGLLKSALTRKPSKPRPANERLMQISKAFFTKTTPDFVAFLAYEAADTEVGRKVMERALEAAEPAVQKAIEQTKTTVVPAVQKAIEQTKTTVVPAVEKAVERTRTTVVPAMENVMEKASESSFMKRLKSSTGFGDKPSTRQLRSLLFQFLFQFSVESVLSFYV
jgi:hypothetical protein